MCGSFWKHFNFVFKEGAAASKNILSENDCLTKSVKKKNCASEKILKKKFAAAS